MASERDDEDSRDAAEVAMLRDLGLSEREAELVVADRRAGGSTSVAPTMDGAATAVALAAAAGVVITLVRIVTEMTGASDGRLARNAVLLLAPALVVLLGLRRRIERRVWLGLGASLAGIALVANAVPHGPGSDTEVLAALHLPVLGWGVVLAAHAGGRFTDPVRRLDAIRFSGEVGVLYVLLGLGGAVLLGLTAALLTVPGLDAEPLADWVLPAGAAGGVVIAGWLAETRPRLGAGLAPLLAQVFTPLFGLMLTAVLATLVLVGPGPDFDRATIALLDAVMVVVLGLAVYGQAARSPDRPAGWDDRLRLLTVGAATALDLGILVLMLQRVGELGLTANRIAALGLNVILLVALGGTAVTLGRALRGRTAMTAVERWQARTVVGLVGWAAFVAAILPLLPVSRA